ncbi:Ectonucleotide pyrophosphatase/phosphodiesterase family member 6 [Gossypium arboreum]|uniref:Ectonucleotide pyrophosphatase/phosphodiesterase family member 6 n=1 Tax=Gossypium arboreum TaxID=29729 RepID=A0A0B0NUR9_GOSAR|nr:Ectonucleotide pyrophosphatase/phosphodiesterase family member 6 [Gossypium arboreum]
MALQIAYFCPQGKRHGHVSRQCETHGHVARLLMDPKRAVADDVGSNAPAPAQGIAPSESRPVSSSHGELVKPKSFAQRKRRADFEARDFRKRFVSKSYQSASKKSEEYHPCSIVSTGISIRDRDAKHFSSKPQTTSAASVGSVRNTGPEYCQEKFVAKEVNQGNLLCQLNRAYYPSAQEELTVHSSKKRKRFDSLLVSDKSELRITLSSCRLVLLNLWIYVNMTCIG